MFKSKVPMVVEEDELDVEAEVKLEIEVYYDYRSWLNSFMLNLLPAVLSCYRILHGSKLPPL